MNDLLLALLREQQDMTTLLQIRLEEAKMKRKAEKKRKAIAQEFIKEDKKQDRKMVKEIMKKD